MKRLLIVWMCIWGISSLSECMKQNVVVQSVIDTEHDGTIVEWETAPDLYE